MVYTVQGFRITMIFPILYCRKTARNVRVAPLWGGAPRAAVKMAFTLYIQVLAGFGALIVKNVNYIITCITFCDCSWYLAVL